MLHAQTTFADVPPAAAEWKRGLLTLPADRSPCPRLGATAWATMLEAALEFVDRFGAEAEAHAWTTPQLFGIHPQHGTLRDIRPPQVWPDLARERRHAWGRGGSL